MSRDIPQDQPLTDEDRQYLLERGAFGQAIIARVDENFPPEEPAALEDEEPAEGDGSEATDWSLYTKADLVAEIENRNQESAKVGGPQLSATGTKQELVDRLTADDERLASNEE